MSRADDHIRMKSEMQEIILKLYEDIKKIWMENSTEENVKNPEALTNIVTTFLGSILNFLESQAIVNSTDIFVVLNNIKEYYSSAEISIKDLTKRGYQ